jgi:hypothetical protein
MSSLANWVGNFKQRYGRFQNPLAEENTFAEYLEFIQQDYRPGLGYNFPIVVGNEHGQTADVSNTAFAFNPAIDSQILNAQLDGATIGVVGNVPYDVSFKGNNGAGNGSRGGAFWKPYDLKVKMLLQSANLYRELLLMYGCGGTTFSTPAANIGIIGGTPSGTLNTPNVSQLTLASNAPGMWGMMAPGALVDIYQGASGTIRAAGVTVQGYNKANGALTLFLSGSGVTPAVGDTITPYGWKQKSAVGLEAILLNQGTLFGINAALVPPWKAVQIAVGGVLSRTHILNLAAQLAAGAFSGGGRLFVSPASFSDLVIETFALQQFPENTASVKQQGAEKLLYKTSVGVIEVVIHRYMKQGEAWFLAPGKCKRVGSTDVTTKGDGPNDMFFLELQGNAGYQMRAMQNQAPVLEIPGFCGILTGIVNSASSGAVGI